MTQIKSFLIAGLFLSTSLAHPTRSRKQTYQIIQVGHTKTVLKHPAFELKRALTKYGVAVPPHVDAAASGTVVASPESYDKAYLSPVTIGGTTFQLDLDTGSADLWLFSTELPTSQQAGHALYSPDPNNQLSGASWSIQYGDGSGASGDVYTDTVEIGGVSIANQPIEAAQTISAQFSRGESDGLFGIGLNRNTISTGGASVVSNLWPTLAEPIIGVALSYKAPGEYDIGYTNTALYTGPITYVGVDASQGFFSLQVDDVSSSGTSLGTAGPAIGDTGTSLLLLPNAIVDAYWQGVSGASFDSTQGGYIVPCSTTPADITLSIGGYAATVPGAYLIYAPVDASGQTCFGGLQYASGGLSILGDVFLKSQYVVFNYQTPSFGIAARV